MFEIFGGKALEVHCNLKKCYVAMDLFLVLQSATDDDTDIEDDEEEVEPSKKRRIETPEEASTVSLL